MRTLVECNVLGRNPANSKVRKPRDVSQLLHAIQRSLDGGTDSWELKSEGQPAYRMFIASDRAARERAYLLAHRVYEGRGYVPENSGQIASVHDASPETLTLLARDEMGRDAATVTLVFDSVTGLPCDEIYGGELNALRLQGRRLVEVTRLAIAEEHQRSKLLLVRLFNFIYVFARRVRGFDDFMVEVNPRHVNYYRRLLNFSVAGPERPCPRVQGSPAVLLRLDLAIPDREVRRCGGQGERSTERTLYPHFYSWLEEGAVAEFMARTHTSMTEDEMRYFGIQHAVHAKLPAV